MRKPDEEWLRCWTKACIRMELASVDEAIQTLHPGEIDNKGNHLLVHDESSINVPAVAAAHVIKRYTAQAADELSFEVGDIVSVIDMPPKEDTGWWRGKHGFQFTAQTSV
ncbi:hypothetical protein MHYP_G00196410 [Metynnis hypsauchen]